MLDLLLINFGLKKAEQGLVGKSMDSFDWFKTKLNAGNWEQKKSPWLALTWINIRRWKINWVSPTPWPKRSVPFTPFLGKQAKLRSQALSYSFSFVSAFSQLQAASFLRWRAKLSLLWLMRVVKQTWRTQHVHMKCRLVNLPVQWPLHRSSSCCSASWGCTAQMPHSGGSAWTCPRSCRIWEGSWSARHLLL